MAAPATHPCDVLVVGTGPAGLIAALAMANATIVEKKSDWLFMISASLRPPAMNGLSDMVKPPT